MTLTKDTYERFFNLSSELLCVASLDGRFLAVNDTFSQTLGYPKEELIGASYLSYIFEKDVPKTLEARAQLERGEADSQFTNRYRHK